MGTDNLIIKDYLENLKEDGELDYLFPILLGLMGFRVVATPKDSKGQPQYGKDIIAIRKDDDGVWKRYYFELKGHSDRNINDAVYSKSDGIRDSLIAMKDTPFTDATIPGFDQMPIKYLLVHNGIVARNTQKTLDGFVKREFPGDIFERWGIEMLVQLFSEYMFSEYFLTDEPSIQLLKKTLVLMDSPEYDMVDFRELVRRLLANKAKVKSRSFKKMFASLNLISFIVLHYGREMGNLAPIKNAINYLVLQTWAWILEHKLEKQPTALKFFRDILDIHYNVLNEYFKKTLRLALEEDGLSAYDGGPYEEVGYPLRAVEYLGDLLYFCELRQYYPQFDGKVPLVKKARLEACQKTCLLNLVVANDGAHRLILDNQYLVPVLLTLFFLQCEEFNSDEWLALHDYLTKAFIYILRTKIHEDRWPELSSNVSKVIEAIATNKKPSDYQDQSSLLLNNLMEIIVTIGADDKYLEILPEIIKDDKLDLQVAFPDETSMEHLEIEFFKGNIYEHMCVETSIKLPATADDFRKEIAEVESIDYRFKTVDAGFPFLKTLSHLYFNNDIFPNEWRRHIRVEEKS